MAGEESKTSDYEFEGADSLSQQLRQARTAPASILWRTAMRSDTSFSRYWCSSGGMAATRSALLSLSSSVSQHRLVRAALPVEAQVVALLGGELVVRIVALLLHQRAHRRAVGVVQQMLLPVDEQLAVVGRDAVRIVVGRTLDGLDQARVQIVVLLAPAPRTSHGTA